MALWNQLPLGADIVGVEEHSGKTIAWKVATLGGGEMLVVSFKWIHAMREQEQMLKSLLMLLGCQPVVQCSNPNVWVTVWAADDKSMLFLLNLFSAPLEAEVSVKLKGRRVMKTDKLLLDPVTVKVVDITPIPS